MHDLIDLKTYPLDDLSADKGRALVARCRRQLATDGMFNLDGFLCADALRQSLAEVRPILETSAFTHRRQHNIYFADDIPGLPAEHPALTEFETINHTICADQFADSLLCRIYEWTAMAVFLAAVMDKHELHTMSDPLARINVMSYTEGEALNWHFDRSEFTTTLLLQSPVSGGDFLYRRDLRSDDDPNYRGVGNLLAGEDHDVKQMPLAPGTLNVFKGKNTAHRVTPIEGSDPRIIAVFSYFDRPGVIFSDDEQLGFYGRSAGTSLQ